MSELRNISIFFPRVILLPMKFDIFRDIFELTDMKIVYFQSVFSLKYDSLIWSWCFWFWSGHNFTNLISFSRSYMSDFIFESIMDDAYQNGYYEYYCSI